MSSSAPFIANNAALQQAGLAQQQGYQNAATQNIGQAMSSASPYMQGMAGLTQAGLGTGQQYLSGATGLTQQALQTGQQMGAQAQPYYAGALQAAKPFNQGSAQLTQAALQSAQPGNQAAQQYLQAGAQSVNPQELNYNQYMNPFLSNVVQAQQALQAQENAQARSAMQGKAIQAGAFGGDRAGIEQANLARQQSLANQANLSNLLQSGFNQAQAAAQQQQGVGLGAAQANRQAFQNFAPQLLQIGQQILAALVEGLAVLGQLHAPGGAVQEAGPQLRLQLLHGQGGAGLGQDRPACVKQSRQPTGGLRPLRRGQEVGLGRRLHRGRHGGSLLAEGSRPRGRALRVGELAYLQPLQRCRSACLTLPHG